MPLCLLRLHVDALYWTPAQVVGLQLCCLDMLLLLLSKRSQLCRSTPSLRHACCQSLWPVPAVHDVACDGSVLPADRLHKLATFLWYLLAGSQVCHKFAIHPYNEHKAAEHRTQCQARHDKLAQRHKSKVIECCVCMERVLSKVGLSLRDERRACCGLALRWPCPCRCSVLCLACSLTELHVFLTCMQHDVLSFKRFACSPLCCPGRCLRPCQEHLKVAAAYINSLVSSGAQADPKDRKFGLMTCEHAFCLGCIRGWRSEGKVDVESVRTACE